MAYKFRLPDRSPLEQYEIRQGGVPVLWRVSSSQGMLAFDLPSGGAISILKISNYANNTVVINDAHAESIAPTPGETFLAPADLRFIGIGMDPATWQAPPGEGGAISVDFYLNDTVVATQVNTAYAEYGTFKTRATGIAAGVYRSWCRAHMADGRTFDSRPFAITVVDPPTYGSTVTLSGDEDKTGVAISYVGTAGSRIRINGNGYRWLGTPSSLQLQYCDLYNFGASSGNNSRYGIDLTTSGNTTISNCRFVGCTPTRLTNNGGTVAFTSNLSGSDARNPLGQDPGQPNEAHGSWPCFEFRGTASGAKTFQANNIAAGAVIFGSPNWLIGGDSVALGNVIQGPRCGLWGASPFTGRLKFNYCHQLYPPGWSQGYNHDWSGLASTTIEHCVIMGGSWPLNGFDGTVRYCVLLGIARVEGLIWLKTLAASAHHCILRAPELHRGGIYSIYSPPGAVIRNMTIDGVDQLGDNALFAMSGSGTHTINSCLFMRGQYGVQISGSVTTDYNAFYNVLNYNYADGRTPAHDRAGNPGMPALSASWVSPIGTFESSNWVPFDIEAMWKRTITVTQLLNAYRLYYTPTAVVVDTGDTAVYGAGNDIGAVGAGSANANDLLGTL
jgi:hypothetical protein